MSLHARRRETPRSGLLRRRLLSGALTCAAAVLLVSCGGFDFGEGLSWPAPDPDSILVVLVKNSTTADFYASSGHIELVGVGYAAHFAYWQSYIGAAPQIQSVQIMRGGTNAFDAVPLASVTLRLLKYPAVGGSERYSVVPSKDVTVTITEPRAGVFEATTLDTEWIEILSVVPLS